MLLPLNSACQDEPGATRGGQVVLRYCHFLMNTGIKDNLAFRF